MKNEEELKNLIKKQIIINADETKYRYEIGKDVMDYLADDIIKALKIKELIAENERLKFKHENNALTIKEKRWIPVSEKMPDYTDNYNVVCNVGNMLGGYTDVRTYRFECIKGGKKKWCIPDRFDEVVQVTHWQPLPKP